MARRVLERIDGELIELLRRLAELARAHRGTVMAARTHSQQALPTSFGLKLVGWALPLARHRERLFELDRRLSVVQLGGAAGTLLALGPRALDVADALARELGLRAPELPWHTQRDAIAELGSWLGLCTGSLGKLAQDVILLCQSEVAELSEAPHGTRGGSSSMPQKNNPMRSEQILAAARAVSAHVSALMAALVQEHERGTHGWQVEWLCLSPMLLLTAGAFKNALELGADLVVHPERMRDNVMSQQGLVLAEPAVGALSDAGTDGQSPHVTYRGPRRGDGVRGAGARRGAAAGRARARGGEHEAPRKPHRLGCARPSGESPGPGERPHRSSPRPHRGDPRRSAGVWVSITPSLTPKDFEPPRRQKTPRRFQIKI